jgi:hypothetical protein
MDNIKIVLREKGWRGMDWIELARVRDQWRAVLNTTKNFLVPRNIKYFSSSCKTGGFSLRA